MDLGKAYVQIMPSAKGIKKQVEDILGKDLDNVSDSVSKQFGKKLLSGMESLGSGLTKYITTPALAAAGAVAGVVGALGFKRLIGMDVAQAKLQGLGYEGKQLETIMNNARNAVQGTTFATADGAYVAAGALAAGVAEGAELERYIKLVGDAAIGAGAPIEEMAQIFNRVASEGHLTRNELEMINYRLPGFSNAMMEHVGASSTDAFHEMLRSGQVSTADMLDVMDDFAGGMAEAYAGTWSGLKDNILANIGIIGEALLEGLFEDGKQGMAEFLDYLRNSEGLKEWARETGETLRVAFESIIETVKTVIDWWSNLDGETKKMIGVFLGIAVATGPVLLAISKIITVITTLISGFGLVKAAAGIVAGAIGSISAPVLIVIGVITGLIALFTTLYNKNETFRDLVNTVWETIKDTISTVIQAVSDFVMDIFGGMVDWWNENNELILETVSVVWETMQENITKVLDIIVPIIQAAWDVIKIATETVWNIIKTVIDTVIKVILGIIKTVMQIITGDWKGAWDTIKNTVSTLLGGIKNIISNLLSGAFNIIKSILSNIKNRFSNIFNSLKGVVSNAFNKVKNAVSDGISKAYDKVIEFISKFKDAGKNIVGAIADGIKGAIGKVTGAIGDVAQKVRDFLPFSPPKIGPLTDIMDVKWGPTIAGGIEKGERDIEKAMERALDFDLTKKATFNVNSNQTPSRTTQQQQQPIILQIDGKTFAQIIGDYTSQEGGNRIRRIERGLAT